MEWVESVKSPDLLESPLASLVEDVSAAGHKGLLLLPVGLIKLLLQRTLTDAVAPPVAHWADLEEIGELVEAHRDLPVVLAALLDSLLKIVQDGTKEPPLERALIVPAKLAPRADAVN